MEGNFRRAAHDSRIARGVCQVKQRARSQRVLAALRGNLALYHVFVRIMLLQEIQGRDCHVAALLAMTNNE